MSHKSKRPLNSVAATEIRVDFDRIDELKTVSGAYFELICVLVHFSVF